MRTEFSVVAIVSTFNEADIIAQVVGALIDEGLNVFLLDDGSTDGTLEAVRPFLGRGLIDVERLTNGGGPSSPPTFEWGRILERKARLALELDAAWFVHHDADEFRESPWAHVSLKDAIRTVDALGYNAIDFECLDFWPVDDHCRPGDDVRAALPFYTPAESFNRLQIRCWKRRSMPVDLLSSGGHEVLFPDRRVFPVRFILRHYPIRSQAHGVRKVHEERRPRFVDDERAKGWHVQYDALPEGTSFIRDRATMRRYDADEVRTSLVLRHRGVEELEEVVASARSDVKRLQTALEAATVQLEDHRDRLQASQSELRSSRDELQASHEMLLQSREQVEHLRQSLAVTTDESAAVTRELETVRGWARELESEVHRLQSEVGLAMADARGRTRQVDELLQSRSWRWTALPRKAFALLRGSNINPRNPS